MVYSQAQKEKTHKRIVAIASKRFREQGLARFGIAERASAILRQAYRRLCERCAPQESRCGLCLQRIGPGNRSQRQADSCTYL